MSDLPKDIDENAIREASPCLLEVASIEKEPDLHPLTVPRMAGAITVLAFIGGLGITLMLANILAIVGLALGLLGTFLFSWIYYRKFKEIWKIYRSNHEGVGDRGLEVIAATAIIYLFPIICFAIYFRMQEPSSTSVPPVVQSPSPLEVSYLRALSNRELRKETATLCSDLREMEVSFKNEEQNIIMSQNVRPNASGEFDKEKMQRDWDARTKADLALRNKMSFIWQAKYRAKALAINEELSRRLGIMDDESSRPNLTMEQMGRIALLKDGMIAGIGPISSLANYLESLARELSEN